MRDLIAALEELNNATTLRLREALAKIATHEQQLAEAKRQGALEALRDVMEMLMEYPDDEPKVKYALGDLGQKVAALFAQNGRQN